MESSIYLTARPPPPSTPGSVVNAVLPAANNDVNVGSSAPPPARVLLLGRRWDDMNDTLSAATSISGGGIVLLGPQTAFDAARYANGAAPSVLLLAPDTDTDGDTDAVASIIPDDAPPSLRCVAADCLDDPDLYGNADDFVTIPCAPAELVKRILRLAQRQNGASTAPTELMQIGGITLDPVTYQVTAAGRPVDLAWLEFRLFQFLMENVGKVFTRDQLLASVWGVENIGGTRTVDVHIRRLRYKLETGGATYFRTVKNVGYGMVRP